MPFYVQFHADLPSFTSLLRSIEADETEAGLQAASTRICLPEPTSITGGVPFAVWAASRIPGRENTPCRDGPATIRSAPFNDGHNLPNLPTAQSEPVDQATLSIRTPVKPHYSVTSSATPLPLDSCNYSDAPSNSSRNCESDQARHRNSVNARVAFVHDEFADLEALAREADELDGRKHLWPISYTIHVASSAGATSRLVLGSYADMWSQLDQWAKSAFRSVDRLKARLQKHGVGMEISSETEIAVKRWKCTEFLQARKGAGCSPEDVVWELRNPGNPELKERLVFTPRSWVCYRYGQGQEDATLERFAVGAHRIYQETGIPCDAGIEQLLPVGMQCTFSSEDAQHTLWQVRRVA
jgi:hypothetical protein